MKAASVIAAPAGSFARRVARVLVLSVCLAAGRAADKNGVSPSAISVPKGPGSIEGLGESFQPNLSSGTANYGVGISLPPGTAGHEPELRLRYEGGGGNGPLGYGWSLRLPAIQRRSDKGIPLYGENLGLDRADRFINESKEELVPQADGYYFCENEGAFIRYRQAGDHWEGTRPDGTKLEFGLTASGRIEDAATGRVFSWMLERETDTRGNTMVYTYRSFPGEENQNQKFLSSIRYGPGGPPWSSFHFVVLEYEDRPDWFEDCRAGFVVRCGKRLKRLITGTQGANLPGHLSGDWDGDGQPDVLNRQYELGYVDYAGAETHWSLLGRFQVVGADGISRLPATSFSYAVCNPPDILSAEGQVLAGANEPAAVMDNEMVELADLNGDGLPDILRTFGGGLPHQGFLNLGVKAGTRLISWKSGQELGGDARAWELNFQSTLNAVHLADMDGDGMADLAVKASNDEVYFFSNQGSLNWGTRRLMAAADAPPPSPFGRPGVRTADLDFDKRMDVIQSLAVGEGTAYRIWFNLGNQTFAPSVTVEPDGAFDLTDPAVQIADFNGDRVPDLIRIQPERLLVKAGLGYGRFAPGVVVPLPGITLTADQQRQAKLTDMTGDGLADLVLERAGPGQLWYWINRGNYQLSGQKKIFGMPVGVGQRAVVRWADMNGNGTTDLVYADSATEPRLQTVDLGEIINCGATPNVLTSIANGLGRTFEIGYQSSIAFRLADEAAGTPWPNLLPFSVPVVASVRVNDSLGHEYLTEYRYHDGYYDPQQKQFRGFARVEQIERGDAGAPTLVSRSYFDTGATFEAMKGKLVRQVAEEEDGRIYWDQTTLWSLPPKVLKTGTNGQVVRFVHPRLDTKTVKELGQGVERVIETESDYDDFGNVTRRAAYGIVDGTERSAFNDERVTTTEYAINLDRWIVRHPARSQVADENGTVIARTEFYYDDPAFSGTNPGQVAVGNLTLQRDWIDPAKPAAFVRSTRTQYDAYGNAVVLLDPRAEAPEGVVDFSRGHARTVAYDGRFHNYPVTETIYVGEGKPPLVFRATYDEAFGNVLTGTDFNTNTTFYAYDPFPRLTAIVQPGDTAAYPTAEYAYALAVPWRAGGLVNYVETRLLDRSPGAFPEKRDHYLISREYTDGLGRGLMSKHEAEAGNDLAGPAVVVNGANLFNARTKTAATLNPFFSQKGQSLDELLSYESIEDPAWTGLFHQSGTLARLNLEQAEQTRFRYDATLREVRNIHPDGSFDTMIHEPLATRSFDENQTDPKSPFFGASQAHYEDGLGRLIRVDENTRLKDDGTLGNVTQTWMTRYEWDLNDQLLGITDSQGNVKRFTYDGLTRRVSMNDPDRGQMSYVYDDASNVTETTDAKGQKVSYTYDGANRMRTEKYHTDSRFPNFDPTRPITPENRPEVAYFYDGPVPPVAAGDGTVITARFTAGLLAYVWDLSGEEYFSYDAREHAEAVVKRVIDPVAGGLVSYRTGYTFDSLDRLSSVRYPDNDLIQYEYNERGLGRRIFAGSGTTIISNMWYAPSGQLTGIAYGNGVVTRQQYDARLRLQQTRSRQAAMGLEHVGLAYEFDAASNLKAVTDIRPAALVAEGEPRRNTYAAEYDDLYRLTGVRYSYAAPGAPARNDGEIHYRYDRIGNRLAQISTMAQDDPGPSVTQLGEMGYGGAAGRTGRQGRSPTDPPGPHALTEIRNAPTPARNYGYDANGNMLSVDGLQLAWDTKDRLTAVETGTLRAEYNYDHRDRRITKRVAAKATASGASPPIDSTIYVDQYFEVRQNSLPVKYVWCGNTRVARVTGMLSANPRVQRFRLWAGWNLCSLSVTVERAGEQMARGGPVQKVFRWDATANGFKEVLAAETVSSGAVLWIEAATNAFVTVEGRDTGNAPPGNAPVEGLFHPGASGQALDLARFAPVNAAIWRFDGAAQRWEVRLADALAGLSDVPHSLAPGEGIFIRADQAVALSNPDPALNIRYYHQDQLGSSAVISDARGVAVEETAFYPFGYPRYSHPVVGESDPYQFTQKERDRESGLNCLEARFQSPVLGRFLRVDPLAGELKPTWLDRPQRLNLYTYCGNSPLGNYDPNGADFLATAKGFGIGVLEGAGGSVLAMANPVNIVMLPVTASVAVAKGIYNGAVDAANASVALSHGDYEGAAKTAFPTASKLLDPTTSDKEVGRTIGKATGKALVAVATSKALGGLKPSPSPAPPPPRVTVGPAMTEAGQLAKTQPVAPKTVRDPTMPTTPNGDFGLGRIIKRNAGGTGAKDSWLKRNQGMAELYSEDLHRRLKAARPEMDKMIEATGSAKPILKRITAEVESLYGNWD